MQYAPVNYPARYASHQLGVRDRVKVRRQVGIDDLTVTRIDELVHALNRL